MKSLRGRLTAGLLLGTGLLVAAGGWALNHVLTSRLRRDYDTALIERARFLATLTEGGADRVWLQYTDEVMPDFEPRRNPDYFELWLAGGKAIERSRSLGKRDLPRSSRLGAPLDQPLLRDIALPDGRRGRSVEITFHPLSEQDEDRLRDSGQSSGHSASNGDLRVTLVVAHGKEELEAFLTSVHVTLAGVAIGLLLGTAVLVKLVVGVGLAPLDKLGQRLETLGADSLGETLGVADTPAELLPLVRHLNGLLARLRESFARERAFSANLAHELRTPLAELRAIAEVALRWPEDSTSRQASFEEIRAIGLQMETVVINLLALARCDARQSTVHASEVPVRELAASVWSAFSAAAREKGMALQLDLPEDLVLRTDREKLALILANLFSNAVTYGTPGAAIRCASERREAGFALSIRNATTELAPADLPRIFDRFWRKDPARSDGQHAGLGLALVAALCETLGFEIGARLEAGAFEIALTESGAPSSSLHRNVSSISFETEPVTRAG